MPIEIQLLRKMHAAGWTAYSRLHATHNEESEKRDLTFVRNYADLRVSIQKFPATPDSFTISYSLFSTTNSLPIPSDSGFVEFEGSTAPFLVATTSMNIADARAYYDQEMVKQGWLPMQVGRLLEEDRTWLPYLQGQKDISIGLIKMKNGRTLIRAGDNLERDSWQLEKPKSKADTQAPTKLPVWKLPTFQY